jgi:predicted small lipoprotein YifL
MKTITTLAAIAALTTLAACGTAEAPATEAAANEAAATEVVAPEAEKTGGPCGDGTVLAENEKCK